MTPWEIEDTGITAESIIQNGNRMFCGNGFMGYRGTVDEADKSDMTGLIVNGIYDRHGDKWREPVNLPNPLFIQLSWQGKLLSLKSDNLKTHCQKLDFRYGIFSRKSSWKCGPAEVVIESERFLSMSWKNILCLSYKISADRNITLGFVQKIDSEVYDANGPHFKIEKKSDIGGGKSGDVLLCRTLEKQLPFAVARVSDFCSDTITLEASRPKVITVYAAVITNLDRNESQKAPVPVEQLASRAVLQAEKAGWNTLLKNHKEAWEKIWDDGDVIIEGDNGAQRNLRYSLYHLQSIAPRERNFLSIPARGLSAQTYKGAVFWDTELFIFPYFLYTQPQLAREFIEYRIKTLEGAKRKAASYGYEGAFYAWESQEDGDDACSDYNVTDVFTKRPVRTYFRDKQIHINAAIVYSICQYVEVSGDQTLLQQGGFEVIFECAKFYISRCIYIPLKDRYEIHDVIGPDEYHERVNNNAYTNKMVLYTLQKALVFAEKNPVELVSTGFKNYLPLAKDICKKLYIPSPSDEAESDGVIPQFDNYFSLEDCTLETVRSRLLDPKEYWGGANGVAAHTQIIKQADTIVMLNLFSEDYAPDILKANYDYYNPRTEHGSSLSACMYGMMACKTGSYDQALSFYEKTSLVDISGNSKQWAGLVYIGGTHPAAQGGSWMMVVYGFCGFSVKDKKIRIKQHLPAGWKKVTFTAWVCGEKYKVQVTREGYEICKE